MSQPKKAIPGEHALFRMIGGPADGCLLRLYDNIDPTTGESGWNELPWPTEQGTYRRPDDLQITTAKPFAQPKRWEERNHMIWISQ